MSMVKVELVGHYVLHEAEGRDVTSFKGETTYTVEEVQAQRQKLQGTLAELSDHEVMLISTLLQNLHDTRPSPDYDEAFDPAIGGIQGPGDLSTRIEEILASTLGREDASGDQEAST